MATKTQLRILLQIAVALAALAAPALEAAVARSVSDTIPAKEDASYQQLVEAANAVVGVNVKALPNARSNASLGQERTGSGVLIGKDGLVLTIGYLILEADQVPQQMPAPRRRLGLNAAQIGVVLSAALWGARLGSGADLRRNDDAGGRPRAAAGFRGHHQVELRPAAVGRIPAREAARGAQRMMYPETFQVPSIAFIGVTISVDSGRFSKRVSYWMTTYSPSGAFGRTRV